MDLRCPSYYWSWLREAKEVNPTLINFIILFFLILLILVFIPLLFKIFKTFQKKKEDQILKDNQNILDSLTTPSTFLPNDWITLEKVRVYVNIFRISHPYKIKYESQEIGQKYFFFAYGYIDKKRITIHNLIKYLKINIEVLGMSLRDPCLHETVCPGWYFLDESGNNRLRLVETVLGISLYWLKYKKPLPLSQVFRTTSQSLNGSTVNVSLNQGKNGTIKIFLSQ